MNHDSEYQQRLDYAFPAVDPGLKPAGGRIIVQLRRTPKKTTASGIVLVEETRQTENWQNLVAKVVALGPLAFRKRDTMELWPEGVWANIGDYAKVVKYGGERWHVEVPGEDPQIDDPVQFAVINDTELIGVVTGDPLAVKAYI